MNRMAAETAAFNKNSTAPKGVSYFASKGVDGNWGVAFHDGRRNK